MIFKTRRKKGDFEEILQSQIRRRKEEFCELKRGDLLGKKFKRKIKLNFLIEKFPKAFTMRNRNDFSKYAALINVPLFLFH